MNVTIISMAEEKTKTPSKVVWVGVIGTLPSPGDHILLASVTDNLPLLVVMVVHRLEEGTIDIFLEPDVDNNFVDLEDSDNESSESEDVTVHPPIKH